MALVTSATSKAYSDFSPPSISECALWLDAADRTTLTFSGSNVTQWKDKSTRGFIASNLGTITTTTVNGNTALDFGTSRMTISNYSQNVHSTTFLVTKSATGGFMFAMNQYGTYIYLGNWDLYYYSAGGDIIQFKDSANANGVPVVPTNEYSLFAIGYGGGSNTSVYNVNGTARSVTLTGGTARPNVVISNSMFINGNTGQSFDNSQVCEIIVYNNSIPNTIARQVEGYLARKWGLVSKIPATHPYKTIPPVLRPFTPLDISGCLLWLDAQDGGSYTLSSSNVTQWNDKSGNGSNVVRMSSGPTISNLNGYPALYIGGGGSLSNSSLSIPTSYSVLGIANRTSGQDYQYVSKFHVAGDGYLFFGTSNGNFATFAGNGVTTWWDINGNSPSVSVGSNPILLGAINDGTTLTPYTNGIAQNTKTGTTAVATGLAIGSDRLGGQTLNGNLGEYLLYGRPISGAERQQLEGYMVWRWGEVSDLSSSHPFKYYPPMVPAFTPLQIAGCMAWLDALDPNADGSVPANGASVATWKDKSGNGRDAASQAASAPTYLSASNSLSFSGSMYYKLPDGSLPSGNTQYTIVVVCAPTLADYQWVFAAGYNDNRAVGLVFYPNGTLEHGWWTTNVRTSAGVFTANQRAIVIGQYNTPGLYTYKDGTVRASNASLSGRNGAAENIYIGNRMDGNPVGFVQPFAGTISEILIFSNALSDSVRRQLEGYLSQKWNLRGSLSSTHAFKTIAA